MPLRDHFRQPLDDETSWDFFHGQWPAMIVLDLVKRLPKGYVAGPHVHVGASVEVDVGAFDKTATPPSEFCEKEGGVATATWAPPQATLVVESDLPAQDCYEVRVYDQRRGRRLVAAVEIVSPSNKDRAEHREAFVAKCLGLLSEQVSVVIVDLVTTRQFNLYGELLDRIGLTDPGLGDNPAIIYAAACRTKGQNGKWLVETWLHGLTLGDRLPTLPLWLADDLAVPLELEASYEETCRVLQLPSS